MEPHSFDSLGGLERPQDLRDVEIGAAAPGEYTHPVSLRNDAAWGVEVEYQRQQPACGAHAGAAIKGLFRAKRFSPRFTWADIKTFDGHPIDAGTDMRSIFKSLTKTGVLPFPELGNASELPLSSYAAPAGMEKLRKSAGRFKGYGYGFIADKSFSGLKQFIYENGPSIVLMRVGSEMWTKESGEASWDEKDILPMRPPAKIVSGHFVVAHSYDEKYIYFLNSFSDKWGRSGHGYFGENYMPYINEAGALFPLRFEKDLYMGLTDPDVKRLQQALNKDPRTLVASSGPGAPGGETDYFGSRTSVAVVRFQSLNGIKPTGYVGPLTRAVLNNL